MLSQQVLQPSLGIAVDAERTRHFTLFVAFVVILFVSISELNRNIVHLYLLQRLFRCQQTFRRRKRALQIYEARGNAVLKHAGRAPGEQKGYRWQWCLRSGELQPCYGEITKCSGHLPGNQG